MQEIASFVHESSTTKIYSDQQQKGHAVLSRTFELSRITSVDYFYSQFKRQSELNHRFICNFESFRVNDATIKLKREFVPGVSMVQQNHVRQSPEQAIRICRDLAEVVAYLHSQGFAIRTLHPSNIIIDTAGHPHLVDFGLDAIAYDQFAMKNSYESIILLSPEGFDKKTPISMERDVWMLGNIIYKQLFFRLPYESHNIIKLMDHIRKRKLTLPPYELSGFNECIFRALSPNPEDRSTAKELNDAMKSITPDLIAPFIPPKQAQGVRSLIIPNLSKKKSSTIRCLLTTKNLVRSFTKKLVE